MEHGSGGVTLEQLAARLALAEDALAVALARLNAVDRDHAASRDERRAQHTALAHLGDLMLALGQRVGKVERAVDAQDELARLTEACDGLPVKIWRGVALAYSEPGVVVVDKGGNAGRAGDLRLTMTKATEEFKATATPLEKMR